MKLLQQSADVYVAEGPISALGAEDVEFLKRALRRSPKGRVRINMHPDRDDRLHEMFIAIAPGTYFHPQKHPGKSEALHVVHGAVDFIFFDDAGAITDVVPLGAGDPERPFYCRMSQAFYHALIIRSDLLIVHEIVNGPFRDGDTVFATFAPAEDDRAAAAAFQAELVERVDAYRSAAAQAPGI